MHWAARRENRRSAKNWKSVSTGNLHTLAMKTDGTLWAWVQSAEYGSAVRFSVGRPMERPTEFNTNGPYILTATWSPDSRRLFLFTPAGLLVAERGSFEPVEVFDIYYRDTYPRMPVSWIP